MEAIMPAMQLIYKFPTMYVDCAHSFEEEKNELKRDWLIFYIKIYEYFIGINLISIIKNIIKKIYKKYKKKYFFFIYSNGIIIFANLSHIRHLYNVDLNLILLWGFIFCI